MKLYENIKKRREDLGITQEDLAKMLGYKSRSTIAKIEAGENDITQSKIVAFAKALKTSPLELMGLIDDPNPNRDLGSNIPDIPGAVPLEVKTIPILGNVHCGTPTYAEEEYIGPVSLNVKADYGLRVEGDSMVGAGIHPGDLVLVARQDDVDDGQLAVILIDDDAAIKRVHRTDHTLILTAENPAYKPIIYQDTTDRDIRILGRVVACLHYFGGRPQILDKIK